MMGEQAAQTLMAVTALGAGAIGGGLGIFSVMVLPALHRHPPDQAVETMQRINEAALSPPFLGVFLGTAVCSAAVAMHSVLTWGDPGAAEHLIGAGFYLFAVLLTGLVNVPANDALALVDVGDPVAAQRAWAELSPRWALANHVRSVAALTAAALIAWR